MEYLGLLKKYPLNRTLSDLERRHQLHQEKHLEVEPEHNSRVIRKNSTFIEVVDKYHTFRGFFSSLGVPIFLGLLCFITYFDYTNFFTDEFAKAKESMFGYIAGLLFFNFSFIALFCFVGWNLHKLEWFTYTHWPVRLNRKTRMVHVFRNNKAGGVLSVKWDDLFICAGKSEGRANATTKWDIRCHVMNKEGLVIDTFAFGEFDYFIEQGLMPHWEYFRRYMEEDPAQLPKPEYYLPITKQREPFWLCMREGLLVGHLPYIWTLLLPGSAPQAIMRYLSNLTCKIPRWPDEIEKLCPVPEAEIAHEQTMADNALRTTSIPKIAFALLTGLSIDAYLICWFFSSLTERVQHPDVYLKALWHSMAHVIS